MQGDCNRVIAEYEVVFDADLLFLVDVFQLFSACCVHSLENGADLKLENAIAVLATVHPQVWLHVAWCFLEIRTCFINAMNSVQLQTWFASLKDRYKTDPKCLLDANKRHEILYQEAENVDHFVNFMYSSYAEIDCAQPVIGCLLALYYRGGILRYLTLQCIPPLIHIYLLALAKRQQRSISMFNAFFIALYNEEILCVEGSDTYRKSVETVRIPSIRSPSVYHDPKKLNVSLDSLYFRPAAEVTVHIGPYPTFERISAENRQIILTRLLKSVNSYICYYSRALFCRLMCHSVIAICQSGFDFSRNDVHFGSSNDGPYAQILKDFSTEPRLKISSQLLLEFLNGITCAIFNSTFQFAVEALDAIHNRSTYELYADAILVTNSIKNSLHAENSQRSEILLSLMHQQPNAEKRRFLSNEMITSASFRFKKMPEDLSPVEPVDECSASKRHLFTSGIEELRKKLSSKLDDRRKEGHRLLKRDCGSECMEAMSEIELGTISEERQSIDGIIDQLADQSTVGLDANHNHSIVVNEDTEGSVDTSFRHVDSVTDSCDNNSV